jgi:hypothetical protein
VFPKMHALKEQLMLTGPDGFDVAPEIGEDAGEKETLRNDRAHIKAQGALLQKPVAPY